MRVVGLPALAVCAGLWAGEAGAATWTYTGTGADLTNFATGAGFVGGPQYFFDLDTAIPLDQIDFYTSFRLLVFLGDDLYGDYNHQIGIVETITPHGANGQFTGDYILCKPDDLSYKIPTRNQAHVRSRPPLLPR